jgi:hypothetical protein
VLGVGGRSQGFIARRGLQQVAEDVVASVGIALPAAPPTEF